MNIIYLHGFQSSALSIKGQQIKAFCQQTDFQVYLPDLNMPPQQVLAYVSDMIASLDQVVLIGSSLGGFYATQLVAKHGVPAVLINPAMRPWQLFHDLFGSEHIPYVVNAEWTLDHAQLDQLQQMALPFVHDADKILVLLQQGDEVLDYREAQRYYSNASHQSMIITEANGKHAMDNFADKIPMALQFLSDCIK
ncbi:alpha/beta fold hydrolase [Acinetobacter sp. ANC 5380]|uniref:Alpha/beta fold hydrolase n=1 Tax=Acinetobacter terrae TaxID=2731247 RepID=A0A4R0EE95_9GAMM|nr:YqiA/YcfP family alpha/beta fold hydrolase [Acinetobacter terrae]NNH15066.1 alpha/beta fold hydrolase [Acinetobacter terrae]NNH76805.1 alpha/beta fold hydrolase [Acinetobacter terrae]TCB54283.1 alpha/beta fold hydrolase [Acinetobacter terrae]